jgi:hypothetical protein
VADPVWGDSSTSSFEIHVVNCRPILNPGFEQGSADWSLSGSAAVVNANQHSGSYSLTMNGGTGSATQVITGLTPNTTYTLSGWDRVSSSGGGNVARLGVRNYGGADTWVDNSSTAYTQKSVTFTTGATSTQATIYCSKPVSGNAAYFDDLTLLPVGPTLFVAFSVPSGITTGVPFALTVTVQDAAGNTVTGYVGTIHFTLTGPLTSMANYTFTPTDGGQHTFNNLALSQVGTFTLTATDTLDASTTGSTTFTVTGPPDHIAFSVPSTITAGVPFAITVTVQDAYGNTVTGCGGMVHFTLTGPAMAMADYTFTAADLGSQTFSNLALSQTGMYTLTGTDTTDPMLTGSIMFTVM